MSEITFLKNLFRRYKEEFDEELIKEVEAFLETENIEELKLIARKFCLKNDKEDLKEKIAYELIEEFFKNRHK